MKIITALKLASLLIALLLSGCSEDLPQLQSLSQDAVILAFGDSLTYGTGASNDADYPSVLAQLIGRKVINTGIPGELSATGLQRLPGLLKQFQPTLLILIHGGNDLLRKKSNEQTAQNLQQMIQLAKNANTEVIMMAVPKPSLLLRAAPFYEQVAKDNDIPIDLKTLASILQSNSTKSDGFHPNDAGYRIMAENLQQLLIDAGAL